MCMCVLSLVPSKLETHSPILSLTVCMILCVMLRFFLAPLAIVVVVVAGLADVSCIIVGIVGIGKPYYMVELNKFSCTRVNEL